MPRCEWCAADFETEDDLDGHVCPEQFDDGPPYAAVILAALRRGGRAPREDFDPE